MFGSRIELIEALDVAWNSGDLDRIMGFYSDDFVLESPIVRDRLGIKDGTLRGKASVRQWWARCLENAQDLRTELIGVTCGSRPEQIAYSFRLSYRGSESAFAVSVFCLNEKNEICHESFFCEDMAAKNTRPSMPSQIP